MDRFISFPAREIPLIGEKDVVVCGGGPAGCAAAMAALGGCPCILGREEDHLTTPVTLQMHVDHVDADALAEYADAQSGGRSSYRWLDEIQKLMDQGGSPFGCGYDFPHPRNRAGPFSIDAMHRSGGGPTSREAV